MSGEYFALMDTLLGDVLQYADTETREGFLPFKDEVLIFFSKADTIFCDSLKQNLMDLMPSPTVVWDLKGGHSPPALRQSLRKSLVLRRSCPPCAMWITPRWS